MTRRPHIPRWKYWLSYLTEVHLESAPTEINPHLYVCLVAGRLQLCAENAVYSYEDRYDNFRLMFEHIKLGQLEYSAALVLGLGLGSVPLLIEKQGVRMERMTFVELDEQIIALAQKYTLQYLHTPFDVVCADAGVFPHVHEDKYDLVISDVFLDDTIPEDLKEPAYLHALYDLLLPGGRIIINTLASTDDDKEESLSYFNKTVKRLYPQATYDHMWENYMIQIVKPKVH